MIGVGKDKKRKYVSLGISIHPEFWDFKRNRPKDDFKLKEHIEILIADKLSEYSRKILELKSENKEFTAKTLITSVNKPQFSKMVYIYKMLLSVWK